MLIGCPYCSHGAISIEAQQTSVQCPGCGRSYRLMTRVIAAVNSERLPSGQYRYRLRLQEADGAIRARVIRAQAGLPLRAGVLITLAYRGSRLIGMTDQQGGVWYVVEPERPNRPGVWAFAAYMSWALLALALLEAGRLAVAASELSLGGLIAMLATLALFLTMPFIIRTLSSIGGPTKSEALIAAAGAEEDDAPLSEEEYQRLYGSREL